MKHEVKNETLEAVSFELSYIDKKGRKKTMSQPSSSKFTFNLTISDIVDIDYMSTAKEQTNE